MQLTDVSKTALASLRGHVIESQKRNPLINDPMAAYCLEKLISLASEEEKDILVKRKFPGSLTNHFALRARKYDQITNNYISNHPCCTVVNLGCGFDTRFWRMPAPAY